MQLGWMNVIVLKYNESRVFPYRSREPKHENKFIPSSVGDRHQNVDQALHMFSYGCDLLQNKHRHIA